MQKRFFTILSVMAVCLLFCACGSTQNSESQTQETNPLAGSWTYTADITEEVSEPYLEYLGDYADSFTCEPLTVSIHVVFREDGTWSQETDESSLQTCINQADSAFEAALEMLAQKAVLDSSADLPEGTTADTIAEQALGMSISDYAQTVKPDVTTICESIPAEFLKAGTYTIDEENRTLYRGLDDGDPSEVPGETWIQDGSTLVLISSDGRTCTVLCAAGK